MVKVSKLAHMLITARIKFLKITYAQRPCFLSIHSFPLFLRFICSRHSQVIRKILPPITTAINAHKKQYFKQLKLKFKCHKELLNMNLTTAADRLNSCFICFTSFNDARSEVGSLPTSRHKVIRFCLSSNSTFVEVNSSN